MNNIEFKSKHKVTIVILTLILIFSIASLANLKHRGNKMIYKNLYSSVQVFGLIMNDYNKEINNANTIKDKADIIRDLSYKLYCLNDSLDFSNINKKFNTPMKPFIDYLNEINSEKLGKEIEKVNDAIKKLNKAYLISQELEEVPLSNFYKNGKVGIWRFELSSEVINYFGQINSIASETQK
ncbi:MAG TPA: hypothetical protein DCL31_05680 [Clostridium sp.]|nr:hypothetical protein [Clostridium sp.]